jgi:hypothetical protein
VNPLVGAPVDGPVDRGREVRTELEPRQVGQLPTAAEQVGASREVTLGRASAHGGPQPSADPVADHSSACSAVDGERHPGAGVGAGGRQPYQVDRPAAGPDAVAAERVEAGPVADPSDRGGCGSGCV